MLHRDGVVMVKMKVLVMMMMIPMKSSAMVMTMTMISSPGRNFPDRFLPAGELFSLGIFRSAEAVVFISDPPLDLGFRGRQYM
jgi:hypothetical protein